MKKILYIILFVTIPLFSQVKIDRDLGEFSKVAVYDGINLELIKSEENKVEITGNNTKFVVVKNKNGDLKIRLNLEKRFSGDRTKVTLFYKTLYSVISHEGSNVFSKETIKQADINIKAHTGSRQNLIVDLNTLNTTAATGAHINISGFALTKNAPNKENAIKLLEYLTGEEAQNTYVNNSYEYPANPKVKPSEIVKSWGEFKRDNLDLNALGKFRQDAIKVFDKTGWK